MSLDQRNLMVRSYLIGLAKRQGAGRLPTYGDLHHAFGGGYQNQGRFLQAIYEDCNANHEPDLTVLVVGTKTNLPSVFEGRARYDTPEVHQRWQAELERVGRQEWSNSRFL